MLFYTFRIETNTNSYKMKQNVPLTTNFFIRRSSGKDSKTGTIYMRITVVGKRYEFSIKREVEISKWNTAANTIIGTSAFARATNEYINMWRNKVYEAQKKLIEKEIPITIESIKVELLGTTSAGKTLLETFDYNNQLIKERVGKDYAPATLQRYITTRSHLVNFMYQKYKIHDIPLKALTYTFVADLHHYLITIRACNSNSAAKYIKILKRIIHVAIQNEWLEIDPFLRFPTVIKPVDRDYLTPDELRTIEEKEITNVRLASIRDIFVFSCYTGLAYIDVANLTQNNISLGINGSLWLMVHRQKTKSPSNVPLLPKAIELIKKYQNHPLTAGKTTVFPIPSNQKVNAYLKEIATICDIVKVLTFHMARHTFATTVTLTNGVSIESVSAMLGHTSIKTTQIYAKVVMEKIAEDMEKLTQKMNLEAAIKNSNQIWQI